MDLTLSPASRSSETRCGAGSRRTIPGPTPEGDEAGFEFRRAWQRKLNERGWAGLSWPSEYGGSGATLVEQAIFYEEIARAGAPQMANVLGLAMGGPTVIAPRHRGAEGALPRADPVGRRDLVPGLLRAASRAPTSRR